MQRSIEEQAGLSAAQQAVLFDGKMLSADAKLADVGLSDGERGERRADEAEEGRGGERRRGGRRSARRPRPSPRTRAICSAAAWAATRGVAGWRRRSEPALSSALGMPDRSKLGDMDMGAMGEQYEKMMEQMMDSPMIDELLNDPEKIEQSRQLILQNPMMVNMFKWCPASRTSSTTRISGRSK